MEFRLWTDPLDERYFNNHVETPKSYVGNNPSASYHSLVRRYSFDDNTTLSDTSTIRDVSANQTTTVAGYTNGFDGVNMFESVDVPFAHAESAESAMDNEQVVHNEMVQQLKDPIFGQIQKNSACGGLLA